MEKFIFDHFEKQFNASEESQTQTTTNQFLLIQNNEHKIIKKQNLLKPIFTIRKFLQYYFLWSKQTFIIQGLKGIERISTSREGQTD